MRDECARSETEKARRRSGVEGVERACVLEGEVDDVAHHTEDLASLLKYDLSAFPVQWDVCGGIDADEEAIC